MVNHIKISDIDASDRLRAVDRDHSELLAASMCEIGSKQPITIRPTPSRGLPYKLVIGAHRLDAFGLLGWTELEVGKHVVIEEMDDDQARLAEIDENLARHELNALDRAFFLQERKRLYEALYSETKHGGSRKSQTLRLEGKTQKSGLFRERFSRNAAKKLGLAERTVQFSIDIASRLDHEAVRSLSGTKIARNQRELFEISRLPAEQQRAVAALIGEGKVKTSLRAKYELGLAKEPKNDPLDLIASAIIAGWPKLDRIRKETVLDALDDITWASAKGGRK